MSRASGDDYEEDYNNAHALYRANAERALKGERGRRALRDFREALHALPERRLIANACSTVGIEPDPVTAERPPSWGEPGFDFQVYQAYRDDQERRELLAEQGRGLCSVAAYVWHQKVKAGADPQQAMADLPLHPDYDGDDYKTPEMGVEAGLTSYLAWELMWINDEKFSHLTPEARWVAVVAWIDSELRETTDA